MGLEIVIKDIQEGARAEVSRIKAEGDAKASEITNEAKEVQKKMLGDSLAKVEEDLQKLHQQVISSANLEVKSVKDIYDLDKLLRYKEKLENIFAGDRTRFFRKGEIDPVGVCREINVLLTGFRLPLTCINFGTTGKNLKLPEYI